MESAKDTGKNVEVNKGMDSEDKKLITALIVVCILVLTMIIAMQTVQALKLQKDLKNLEIMDEILEDCKLTDSERVQIENF